MIPIRDMNPSRTFPFFTILIIMFNSGIFILEFIYGKPDLITREFGLVPSDFSIIFSDNLSIAPIRNIFTSMFLHGGLLPILGNMWFLWVFGNNVEDAMGHLKFIIFYILCGIGAAMTQTIAAPNSQIPMVGASGAISGVLGAYLFLYPRAIVLTAVPIFFFIKLLYIPAAIFITLWFIFQILSSINMNPSGGGVAWFAHIGGFISGIVFLKAFYTRRKR